MALLYMDGFDLYGSLSDLQATDWSVTGAPTIGTTSGRYNGSAVRLVESEEIALGYSAADTDYIVQVFFLLESLSTTEGIVELNNGEGGDTVRVEATLTGALLLRDTNGTVVSQTGDGAVGINEWHYLEFKVEGSGASATCQVRLDESLIINSSGVDTGSALGVMVLIGRPGGARFDDPVLMDGSGTRHNDFLGQCRISTIVPQGSSGKLRQWVGTGGDEYAAVDDAVPGSPDGDTSYLEGDAKGEVNNFASEFAFVGADVHAVGVAVTSRHTSPIATAYLRQNIKSGSTEANGIDVKPTSTYATTRDFHPTDPNGGVDWTQAAVDALAFGIEHMGT